MKLLSPGQELAALHLDLLETGGGRLSIHEAQTIRRGYAWLSAEERGIYDEWTGAGFCRACKLSGDASPAGHGPDHDLCQACAEKGKRL